MHVEKLTCLRLDYTDKKCFLFSYLSNIQKSVCSICFKRESWLIFFRRQVNSEDLVFVCHLNTTPAEMSQGAGWAITERGFYNTFCVQCVAISLALQYGDLTSPRVLGAPRDVCNLGWHGSPAHCFWRHCSPATSPVDKPQTCQLQLAPPD